MCPDITLAGKEISMYDLFNTISLIAMAVFAFSQVMKTAPYNAHAVIIKKTKHSKERFSVKKESVIFCTVLEIGVFALFGPFLNRQFGDLFTSGNANYYGILVGWLIAFGFFAILLRITPLRNLDHFTPALPLGLFFFKLACFFEGCCFGFTADTFYFNQETGRREFPVQLVEAAVAVVLFFMLLVYRKKNKRVGTVYPLYLLAYSFSRILTEFLRADFPNVWGPFDAYQLMSAVFFAIGAVLMALALRYGERWDAYFNNLNLSYLKKKESGPSKKRR